MKILILLLISIVGITFVSSSQQVHAELLSNGVYLLQANGFAVLENSIADSQLDFQISTGKSVNSRMNLSIEDGLIIISDNDYIASDKWKGTSLSNGRFLTLSGNAENEDGNEISISLLGRLVQHTFEGSVYSFTGKITTNEETMKVVYTVKIVGSSNVVQETTEKEKPTQQKIIQISILPSSSKSGNINYYSLDTVTITPGTTIIWKNDDIVSHTINSGIASFSHGKPFKPDGKISSGEIASGKTFSVTISELGITRFFDDKYNWMDGVIICLPDAKSTSLGKNTETALDTRNKYQKP